jgi:asparagine synthase (glutamine-hydrolysing)
MGAFILIKRPAGTSVKEIEDKYRASLNVFDTMRLPLNKRIIGDHYVIHVFHKYNFALDNVVQFDNNQFIVATGTLMYNRKIGHVALRELFDDFSEDGKFLDNALGNYCLIVSKNERLYVLNDYTGLYHVYHDNTNSIVSNSFLAVLKALNERSISTQGLYEYVIHGACFGDATLFNEISLLSSKKIWRLFPNVSAIPRASSSSRPNRAGPFNEVVEEIAKDLIDYFNIIKSNFGNSISSALSGGVHTRLMLGLMRKVGIKPDYLYVYGKEENTAGRDANVIQIVRSIANGEGLSVEHIDKEKFPEFTEDEYPELLKRNYYLGDGLGHEAGVFDNGSDMHYRLSRSKKAALQLNGGGGEVLRNYWKLPDKSYSIGTFFKARYDRMDYSVFTDCFDPGSHFYALREKIKVSLGTDKDRLNRRQIELLQPEFDNKYWMGSNNSINNILSYSLTPFAETSIQFRACNVALKYKDYFRLEATLMKYIDAKLAGYPTSHGIDLFSNHLETKAKLKYMVTLNTPLWLKAYIRKHYWHQKTEIIRLTGNSSTLPFYLAGRYLKRIFSAEDLCMSRYVDIEKIAEPDLLSRVLTAELVITDRF